MIGARASLRLGIAGLCLGMLAACAREDEDDLRARLGAWFALGDTVAFQSEAGCAAAVIALVDPQPRSALPMVDSAAAAAVQLPMVGRIGIARDGVTPDDLLLNMVNGARSLGMPMRQAALEGRACMDDEMQAAFLAALAAPGGIVAWEVESGTLALVDAGARRIVVAMGGR